MANKKLSKEEAKEKALELLDQGVELEEVAEKVHRSESTIRRYQREHDTLARGTSVQFYLNNSEYEELEEYRDHAGMSKSEFIRQAIFEKIMRMKSPDHFQSKGINGVSKNRIKEVLETTTENKEKITLVMEKLDRFMENVKLFELYGGKDIVQEKKENVESKITELFEEKEAWKVSELQERLDYTTEEILTVLKENTDKFSMDIKTGGFKRNDQQ